MAEGEEFDASLMNDIDPHMLAFIQTTLNSFIKWDLVQFFHENPHMADTADGIARTTGRDVRVVEPELLQLARAEVLDVEEMAGMRLYTLTDDRDLRAQIAAFFRACDDRLFRTKAIYHVILSLR